MDVAAGGRPRQVAATQTADAETITPPEDVSLALASQAVKPAADAEPAKRSKKGKRKAALTPAELEVVRIIPLSKRSAALAEESKIIQLSKRNAAPQVQLSEDFLSATFHKGYRMVRATHGAAIGTYYYEATITQLGDTGHCRLGWSSAKGELQGPVGYDEHSFAYRDLEGSKVHKALRQQYGEPFREGDVIGCFLHLPETVPQVNDPKSEVVVYKGALYAVDEAAPEPQPVPGSIVAFSRNGAAQGVAFRDIVAGKYFPAVSMFTLPHQKAGATVMLNFGPGFKHDILKVEGCPDAVPAWDMAIVKAAAKEPLSVEHAQLTDGEGDTRMAASEAAQASDASIRATAAAATQSLG